MLPLFTHLHPRSQVQLNKQQIWGGGSGAGTNLKVGAPVRLEATEIFFGRAPPLFWL